MILATGAAHKTLGVPGEAELAGHGVSYCATCDGPFFKNKRMLVVGGGDAACDEAMYLSHLASGILMIHRRDKFRAQKSLAARVLANPKIEVRFNTELRKIEGSPRCPGSSCSTTRGTRVRRIGECRVRLHRVGPQERAREGPWAQDGRIGYVVTNQRMETEVPGLYAVGDVRDSPFRQLVVAAAEGGIAAHAAGQYIDELKGEKYS